MKQLLPLVCVIDDDKEMLSYISMHVRQHGFAVKTAMTGAAGIALVNKSQPSLVLLDLFLPDIDGVSVCKEIKSQSPDMPVIMLTAKDSIEEKVKGLNSGADDYIPKPFAPEELIARIHARLRTSSKLQEKPLVLDDLILDAKRITVTRGGKPINLTPNEFNLLQYMLHNIGIVLTRDMILNNVWLYSPDVETRVVDVYMGYLRRKIDLPGKKKLLHSIRGFGYTLKAS